MPNCRRSARSSPTLAPRAARVATMKSDPPIRRPDGYGGALRPLEGPPGLRVSGRRAGDEVAL